MCSHINFGVLLDQYPCFSVPVCAQAGPWSPAALWRKGGRMCGGEGLAVLEVTSYPSSRAGIGGRDLKSSNDKAL